MWLPIVLRILIFLLPLSLSFKIPHIRPCCITRLNSRTNPPSVDDAHNYLSQFDEALNAHSYKREPSLFLSSPEGASFKRCDLRECLTTLRQHASRVLLGICSDDPNTAIQTLKSFTCPDHGLKLPKGLLLGLDVGGIIVDTSTWPGVYIKYKTSGAMTFSEIRKSGMGFEALWKPGDAIIESYDGTYRGVYFTAELDDDVFRQYGVLPEDLWDVTKD